MKLKKKESCSKGGGAIDPRNEDGKREKVDRGRGIAHVGGLIVWGKSGDNRWGESRSCEL